jgi:hypothetical protein
MSNIFVKSSITIILFAFLLSCGNKKDEKTTDNKDTSSVSTLVKKDPTSGKDKAMLKYMVHKGDKFLYKMTAKTSTSETSPATGGKEEKQDNEVTYFYDKEVTDVDPSGIMSFKVKYDSIYITAKMDTQTVVFKSNIKDSVNMNPAFIQYNAVINEPFYIRVSRDGEITDVYGLEKIHENIFKALGDTLKEEDKAQIKESFGKESIKEILQQEYQLFPKQEVSVDSSWVRSYNTQVLLFEVVNTAKYTLKSIENNNNVITANIEAGLNVDFLNKEVKQKGVKFTIENSETTGSGKITFNLNKGCITNKETTTALNLAMKMSAQGQSAKSEQKVTTTLNVKLLN